MRALSVLLGLLCAACVSAAVPERRPALLLHGGAIRLAAEGPVVEALLVVDGRVVAGGTGPEMEARARALQAEPAQLALARLDLAGATAVPGLIDAHGHLEGLGEALESVDLVGCTSLDELCARVAERAAEQPRGTWVLGRGWDQTLFPGREFPAHPSLSARVPDHPVFLERVDGHAAFVNARALELAGLRSGALPSVEGGRIVTDAAGAPTGVLVDAATTLVSARIPAADAATRERRVLRAQEALLAHGLVGMHDMGTSAATLEVLRRLARDGRLKLRVASYLWANEGLASFGALALERAPEARLRVLGAKLMIDGALGSRGAALLAPYADEPDERGLLQMSADDYAARLAEALTAGLQPATHAIGDEGNRLVLQAYAEAFGGDPVARAWFRPRLEHAQVVAPEDWAQFDALGVIPSMQPTHATSDMRWAEARLGPKRLAGAYAWRRLPGPHAPLACGSDFPVESPSPLLGLYAARTRQDARGEPPGGWLPDQRLSGAEALAGFTSGAAHAAHEEERRGKLLPGFAADLTVLSVDPVTCEPRALLGARVLATIVDGELVHSALPEH
ncbi:MAG TPA: amidohydrolase [Planctomycetota bacterium]